MGSRGSDRRIRFRSRAGVVPGAALSKAERRSDDWPADAAALAGVPRVPLRLRLARCRRAGQHTRRPRLRHPPRAVPARARRATGGCPACAGYLTAGDVGADGGVGAVVGAHERSALSTSRRPPVATTPASDGRTSTLFRIVALSVPVSSAHVERMSAADPDTCGVAIDVPLKYW